jgi:hypothetical protein
MNRKLLLLDSEDAMLLDGLAAVVWQIEMVRSVSTPPRVKNIIPGVLYTFIFRQDQAGQNTFIWPQTCENASAISLRPYSYTVQNFIGTLDGKLLAHLPATYL